MWIFAYESVGLAARLCRPALSLADWLAGLGIFEKLAGQLCLNDLGGPQLGCAPCSLSLPSCTPHLFSWWQGPKRESGSAHGLLKLRAATQSLPLHCIDPSKSHGQTQTQGMKKLIPHFDGHCYKSILPGVL